MAPDEGVKYPVDVRNEEAKITDSSRGLQYSIAFVADALLPQEPATVYCFAAPNDDVNECEKSPVPLSVSVLIFRLAIVAATSGSNTLNAFAACCLVSVAAPPPVLCMVSAFNVLIASPMSRQTRL